MTHSTGGGFATVKLAWFNWSVSSKKLGLLVIILAGLSVAAMIWLPWRSRPTSKFPPVKNFSLPDQDGKTHTLYDYGKAEAIVIMGFGNGCPIVQLYAASLGEIQARFEPLGVKFLLIDAHTQDDAASIRAEVNDYGIKIPVLLDANQIVTRSLGIVRTTETVIITPEDWQLRYRGAIDDEIGYGSRKREAQKRYLITAIEDVLRGREPAADTGEVKGCAYSFWQEPADFNKSVKKVVADKCLQCHGAGASAPELTSENAVLHARDKILQQLLMNKVPHAGGKSLESEEAFQLFSWLWAK
jgi:peroxiredoxin